MTRQQDGQPVDGPPVTAPPPARLPPGLGAVVLAGGRSARFGGVDKTRALLDGEPLLGHVLRAVPAGVPLVVVGPRPDDVSRLPGTARLRWVLEERRFGGPVVALAAGEQALPHDVRWVLVLAGDQPFAAAALPDLFAAVAGHPARGTTPPAGAWLAADGSGTPQPLLAVYARDALRRALHTVLEPAGPTPDRTRGRGPSMRRLLGLLDEVREVAVPPASTTDVDTPADLDATRQHPDRSAP